MFVCVVGRVGKRVCVVVERAPLTRVCSPRGKFFVVFLVCVHVFFFIDFCWHRTGAASLAGASCSVAVNPLGSRPMVP